jgi:hypothetical protein
MRSSLVVHAAEQASRAPELTPVGVGIVVWVVLIALLLVTYAFRSIGSRYRDRDH